MIRSELTTRNAQKLVKANIESILPCNEMQQAFFLLSQQSANDPGVILAQAELHGKLDRTVFERCWNLELARHEALRMSVRPKKDGTPMMVIWKELEQEVEFLDEPLGEESRDNLIARMKLGVELEQPPVSRIVIEPIGQDIHRIFWAFHHLFMDGWSTSVVLRDVVNRYCALSNGEVDYLPTHKPRYAEYFQACKQHDFWAAREHWAGELDGFEGCSPLPKVRKFDGAEQIVSDTQTLAESTSTQLQSMTRESGLTSGVLAAGAWSLVIHKMLESEDIAIGVTVSGRNVPLEGIHNFVGLLSSVIPFRSQLEPSQNVGDWLSTIREKQFRSQQFEYLPLGEIEELSEMRPRTSLFESLLVVENFRPAVEPSNRDLNLCEFSSGATSSYPITCFIIPGDQWKIRVDVKASIARPNGIAKALTSSFARVLGELANANESAAVQEIFSQMDSIAVPQEQSVEASSEKDANAAYTETELRLASIWEKVLGLSQVLPGDNFFEIGGRSVTAVRICAAIESEMGVTLSPSMLIEHPTIAQLAKTVSSGQEGFSPIIRFNEQQTDDLVVCAHVGTGYASYYRHLARHLGEFQVIGVQSTGMNDGKPAKSFEELAKLHADGIERISDAKRIHLIGYCMSARFIVALARELQRRGHHVSNLVSIDSGPYWQTPKLKLNDFIVKSGSVVRGTVRYTRRSYYRFRKWLRYQAASVLRDTEFLSAYRSEFVGREASRAFARYDLCSLEFPFKLIRSKSYSELEEKDFHWQWRKYADDFEYCTVETSHEQILLEPDVRKIADVVRGIIEPQDYSANSTIWRN